MQNENNVRRSKRKYIGGRVEKGSTRRKDLKKIWERKCGTNYYRKYKREGKYGGKCKERQEKKKVQECGMTYKQKKQLLASK